MVERPSSLVGAFLSLPSRSTTFLLSSFLRWFPRTPTSRSRSRQLLSSRPHSPVFLSVRPLGLRTAGNCSWERFFFLFILHSLTAFLGVVFCSYYTTGHCRLFVFACFVLFFLSFPLCFSGLMLYCSQQREELFFSFSVFLSRFLLLSCLRERERETKRRYSRHHGGLE